MVQVAFSFEDRKNAEKITNFLEDYFKIINYNYDNIKKQKELLQKSHDVFNYSRFILSSLCQGEYQKDSIGSQLIEILKILKSQNDLLIQELQKPIGKKNSKRKSLPELTQYTSDDLLKISQIELPTSERSENYKEEKKVIIRSFNQMIERNKNGGSMPVEKFLC
jgi:hypothetical protein